MSLNNENGIDNRSTLYGLLFLIYLLIVAKLGVVRVPLANVLDNAGIQTLQMKLQTANFVLFDTIKMYLEYRYPFWSHVNLLGNIFAFVPLGLLPPLAFKRLRSARHVFFFSLFVILCVEVGQLFTGLGQFDVDDIFLNLIGAMLGYALYLVIKKRKTK